MHYLSFNVSVNFFVLYFIKVSIYDGVEISKTGLLPKTVWEAFPLIAKAKSLGRVPGICVFNKPPGAS